MEDSYIFCIYSCKKNSGKAEALYDMFGSVLEKRTNIKVLIVYGDPSIQKNYILNNKYLILKVPDDYYHLHYKTLEMFKMIHILFPKCKGCFKCDDDMILNIPSILSFLAVMKEMDLPYCGKVCIVKAKKNNIDHLLLKKLTPPNSVINTPAAVYCCGPLYYINNKSLHIIQNTNAKEIEEIFYEDVMVGYLLNKHQIYPINNNLCSDISMHFNYQFSFHNIYHNKILISVLHNDVGEQLFQVAEAYALSKELNRYLFLLNKNADIHSSPFSYLPNFFQNCIDEKKIPVLKQNVSPVPDDDFLMIETSDKTTVKNPPSFDKYKNEFQKWMKQNTEYDSIVHNFANKNSYFIHLCNKKDAPSSLYYKHSIERILSLDPSAFFYIFTDDISFYKKFSPIQECKNVQFIEDPYSISSLYIMSLCEKGGIVSNDSISWWGAYLNTNEKKLVFLPSKWL